MDRDSGEKRGRRQAQMSLLGNTKRDPSLEHRVACYLLSKKGEKSLCVFAVELGIPKQSLKRYLESSQSMSLFTLQKIAKALGVTPIVILTSLKK